MRKVYLESVPTTLFSQDFPLPNLLFISRVHNNPNWVVAPVKNDLWCEIIFVDSGKAYYTINGKSLVATEGDIVILNASVVHDARSDLEHPVDRYSCAFKDLKLLNHDLNQILPNHLSPIIPTGKLAPVISSYFKMIYYQCTHPGKNTFSICQHSVCALFALIDDAVGECVPDTLDYLTNPMVNEIVEYMDNHYMEPLTLDSISKKFFISPDYLSHIIKDSLGISPINYLINRRIGESQHLLLSTMLPISIISEIVGYPNVNHFSTAFKKKIGVSPSEFRRQFNIDSIPPNVSKHTCSSLILFAKERQIDLP